MSFPTARSMWYCKDCLRNEVKQLICKSNEKSDLGYYLIINMQDGPGGSKGEQHVCPFRLQAGSQADKTRMQKLQICARCKSKFYGMFVMCPFCFKVVCTKCSYTRDWRLDVERAGCPKCGHLYSEFIEVSKYIPAIGKYVKTQDVKVSQYL